MDTGLKGKKASVCAASKGLGRACAISLAREGVELVITARTAETLEATAAEIRAMTGAKVTAVAGDITTEAGRAGDPSEFGDACAFLCAVSSSFIVGQNLVLDGGAFNSSMG